MWWLILCVTLAEPQFPDISTNSILDVSVRLFLTEINIWIDKLWAKQIALQNVVGRIQFAEVWIEHSTDLSPGQETIH